MTPKPSLFIRLTFLATVALTFATACSHAPMLRAPTIQEPPRAYVDVMPVHHPEGDKSIDSLPSRWTDADSRLVRNVTIIFVPGSGNQTTAGIQVGNGFANYSKPLALGTFWQNRLAQEGYDVLSYDKRPKSSGPSVLADDVDSACEAVQRRFGENRPIMLWSSEQGTQVVLNAKCLQKAKALILISPIPDALDRVWVSGLKEGGFRDRALSLTATFDSIRKGLFDSDAKIMGASLGFWRNWLSLAEKTPKQLESLSTPVLFAVGEDDVWLGTYGRRLLEKVVAKRRDRRLVVVPKADRNLLQKEALSPVYVETILRGLDNLGKVNGH